MLACTRQILVPSAHCAWQCCIRIGMGTALSVFGASTHAKRLAAPSDRNDHMCLLQVESAVEVAMLDAGYAGVCTAANPAPTRPCSAAASGLFTAFTRLLCQQPCMRMPGTGTYSTPGSSHPAHSRWQ